MSPSPERWRLLEELYRTAIERPPDQRAAFLKKVCPDEDLRREVEALLRFERQNDTLMQHSPWAQSSGIKPGTRFGPYEIECRLGAGGMGEVWKARDTRLGRSVALKVSKTEFNERFEREARAVAALNHPNIATLYDIGPDYFVMEYVDGKPLQHVITRNGLSLGESLHYGAQIADALASAHAAGIIHRDVKPGNVMITSSGQVKVDFGLARMEVAKTPGPEDPMFTRTAEGVIAGTLSYMSPEQAQGRPVDARSDIFSFGAVFYEMLAGTRAFPGDSAAVILSAILTKDPPPTKDLPHDLERVLNRCLRKDPAHRAQSMADVRVALLEPKADSDSRRLYSSLRIAPQGRPGAIGKARRLRLWAAAIAGVGILLATGFAAWMLFKAARPAPPLTIVPLTTYAGSELYPSFSPDGNQVAFSWDGEKEDNFDINGGHNVQESPDGNWLYYLRGRWGRTPLMKMPSAGGPETQVLSGISLRGFTPASKGVYFIQEDGPRSATIRFLNEATGVQREVQAITKPLWSSLDVSPDERFVLWTQADQFGIDLMMVENFR